MFVFAHSLLQFGTIALLTVGVVSPARVELLLCIVLPFPEGEHGLVRLVSAPFEGASATLVISVA